MDLNERRREVLYTLISLAGAGLFKIVWDRRSTNDQMRVTHQVGASQSGTSSTFRVAEGEFTTWNLTMDLPTRFEYTLKVLQGPPIDIILTDDLDQATSDSSEWQYYPGGSRFGVSRATVVEQLPPGSDYFLIFDNSNRLETKPPTNFQDDPAILSFRYNLSPVASTASDGGDQPTANESG